MEEKKLQPNALVDYLLKKLDLKNDKQLADYFDVLPPVISKIRNGRMAVSANMILLIHEKLDMPVSEIRKLIDQTRKK